MKAPAIDIRPFAFDRIFAAIDPPVAQAGAADLRLRVAALEAELALARHAADASRDEAHAAGVAAGKAAARAGQEAALLSAVDALHAAVEDVEARLEAIADAAVRNAALLARTAANRLAARALADDPAGAIDGAIGRALAQVARGQDIQVSVAPALAADLDRLIAARQAGDRRHLALHVAIDPALTVGDAHIRWEGGGLVLDAAARAAAVDATFAEMGWADPGK